MSTGKPKTRHRTGAAETINPDHIGMHRLIVVGVVITLGAAVATSWNGLMFVAGWQLLPEYMRWVTPVMIDVPLIVLTLARGALKKRGVRARGLFLGIVGLTLYSSAANFAHTVDGRAIADPGVVMGALTNALAPWLILSLTEVLWLVVTKPIKPKPVKPVKAARRAPARAPRAPRAPQPQPQVDESLPDPLFALRESAGDGA